MSTQTFDIADLAHQASLLRNQTLQLSSHYSSLGAQYQTAQRESHDCFNSCYDAQSAATEASYDTPYISQNWNGYRVRQGLGLSAMPQQNLARTASAIASHTPPVRAELVRLSNCIAGMAALAIAGPAPVVAALQQAQASLRQALSFNLDMNFGGILQDAQALIGRAGYYNGFLEADAPGQDVSVYARSVQGDIQAAKAGWSQSATLSGQKGTQALEAARLCKLAVSCLDTAMPFLIN